MNVTTMDFFDLPEWLGTESVVWSATSALQQTPQVSGALTSGEQRQQLDLLAVDAAYPRPVCPAVQRQQAHQAWQLGQVALVDIDGRLAVAVPGSDFDANLACEVVRRVAKAVGAASRHFTVSIAL